MRFQVNQEAVVLGCLKGLVSTAENIAWMTTDSSTWELYRKRRNNLFYLHIFFRCCVCNQWLLVTCVDLARSAWVMEGPEC